MHTHINYFSQWTPQSIKIPQKFSGLNTAITLMRLLNDCNLLHYLPLISTDAFEMQTIQRQALKFNTFSFQYNLRTEHCKHTQARKM